MALKSIVESLDDEALKPFYKQTEIDGKSVFLLDVESVGGFSLENVGGLKSALEKTKNEALTQKQALEAFKGLDAKSAREALKELEALRSGDNSPDKIAESKIKQLDAKHQEELSGVKSTAERYRGILDETLRKQVAAQHITANGGNADLLLPHVLSQTRVREVDGQFVVDVVNADGSVRIKDANSNMSIADLVGEMKASTTFGVAFNAPATSGSGTKTNGASSPAKSWSEATSVAEQVAILKAKMG